MINKIVLYTIEKKSKRQIPMVLICRDSAEKDSGIVQVIFGATKPGSEGRDLLPFTREPIDTKYYKLAAMDLWLPRKLRHVVFGAMSQEDAWSRAMKKADRFIMEAGRIGSSSKQITKFNKKYARVGKKVCTPAIYRPPIAILITNSSSLEKGT
jgi:hypothetical protein